MTADPFLLTGPAVVSFSGGRTSGMMLHHILAAHDGKLPADVHVLFANTGKERPETLDFVRDCGERWGVHIVWLEWREGEKGRRFTEVGHNSASRDGEPFAALVAKKRFLPNQHIRFCTQALKVEPKNDWMLCAGYDRWANAIGFRADEGHRVMRTRRLCESGRVGTHERVTFPLYAAGIDKAAVMAFWRAQPFDLSLASHEGNCDLCFLKGADKLRHIMFDRPDLADWWLAQERDVPGGTFRKNDRPDYAHLFATRRRQESFDFDALDADCNCTD